MAKLTLPAILALVCTYKGGLSVEGVGRIESGRHAMTKDEITPWVASPLVQGELKKSGGYLAFDFEGLPPELQKAEPLIEAILALEKKAKADPPPPPPGEGDPKP